MKVKRLALAAACVPLIFSGLTTADAQSDCTCRTPFADGSSGEVISLRGQALGSQVQGLQTVQAGAGLPPGSQVITGAGSSALVVYGSCTVSVGANSELMISRQGADICLQVSETVTSAETNGAATAAGVAAAGAVAGLAALAAAGSGGDDGGPSDGGDGDDGSDAPSGGERPPIGGGDDAVSR